MTYREKIDCRVYISLIVIASFILGAVMSTYYG